MIDPELGEIPVITDDMTKEEIAEAEREVEAKIKSLEESEWLSFATEHKKAIIILLAERRKTDFIF